MRGQRSSGRRGSIKRLALAGVAVLAGALTLAGCGLVTNLVHTQTAIEDAGYPSAVVSFRTVDGTATVNVTADKDPTTPAVHGHGAKGREAALEAQAQGVASVVWQSLPGSFADLSVTIRGLGTRSYDQSLLQQLFGPRPATLSETPLGSQAAHNGATAAIVILTVLVVAVGLLAFFVVRVQRGRRARRRKQEHLMMTTLPPEMWDLAGVESGRSTEAHRMEQPAPGAIDLRHDLEVGEQVVGWPPAQPGFAPPPPEGVHETTSHPASGTPQPPSPAEPPAPQA